MSRAPRYRVGSPVLSERVRLALRREGEADASTLASGLGLSSTVVHAELARGVTAGWSRLVGNSGRSKLFAFVPPAVST